MWRARLDGRASGSWTITDGASTKQAGEHVATLLTTEGIPQLRPFLNRSSLLDHLRAMDHNPIYRSEPLAVLLADAGPSAELDEIPGPDPRRRGLVDWARERAARQP